MGGVHLVGAEHPPRCDHPDGKLPFLHLMHLHPGSLGAQKDVAHGAGHVEGVLLVLGGVVGRDVQGFEIVVILFHLRALHHLVAHAHEDTLHLFQGDGVGMSVAQLRFAGGQSHVDDFRLHPGLSDGFFNPGLALLQHLLNLGPGLVHHLPYLGPLLGRYVPHALQQVGELALLAQDAHLNLVQLFGGVTVLNLRKRLFFDLFQFFFHVLLVSALLSFLPEWGASAPKIPFGLQGLRCSAVRKPSSPGNFLSTQKTPCSFRISKLQGTKSHSAVPPCFRLHNLWCRRLSFARNERSTSRFTDSPCAFHRYHVGIGIA